MPTSADTRRLTTTALLVAVGSVLGLVENAVLPPLPVPGVRIGLANIAVVLALVLVGRVAALRVALLRVIIVGLAAGSLGGPGFLLAVGGAVAAWAVMSPLTGVRQVSSLGVSVAGAAAHVTAQLVLAAVMTGGPAPLLFAPLSLGLAVPCGLAIGSVVQVLTARLPLVQAHART